MEDPHLGGVGQVGAAAELHGVALTHVHHPDHVAVLLAKESNGPFLLGLLNGQFLGDHVVALQNGLVDHGTDLGQLLRGQGGEVGEVKTQPVGLHQGAGLVDMVPQHGAQGLVQQMGGGVGPHNGRPAHRVHRSGDHIAHLQAPLGELAIVHVFAALVLLHVGHLEQTALGAALGQGAMVGHLAAHLRIEGGAVQHHNGLHPGNDLIHQGVLRHNGQHLGSGEGGLGIAIKDRGGHLLAKLHTGPAQVPQGLSGLPGPDPLGLHLLVKARPVQGHPLVPDHLLGEVHREAVGVIELKGVAAGKLGLPLGLVLGQQLGENLHAPVDGFGKVLLLGADDFGDIVLLLPQVLVLPLILMDDGVDDLIQEGLIHPQQLAVAGRPAEEPAQHIAPPLVGGQHPIADHKGGRANVVGDDPQGHVAGLAVPVMGAGDVRDLVGDVHHRVHIEQGVYILAHHSQPLQAHARVNVLLGQFGVVALPIVVKLGKDVVPDLHIPVAVTAGLAVRAAAAESLPPVIVDLGAGAAGAGAVLPEVVLLAHAVDPILGNPHHIPPNVECLVVLQVDRRIEPVRLQTHPLGVGEELPGPLNGVVLEVIPKGEVPQHLKVGAVAGGVADVLNVAGADALLAGAHPLPGGLLLPLEPGLHGGHAGVDQQQGRVVLRHQGKTGQAEVALGLKKSQEHLPQLVQTVVLMHKHTSDVSEK